MTTERRQMTGEEYVRLLQLGADMENRSCQGGRGIGALPLRYGTAMDARDDMKGPWDAYERLIHRFYGTTLVTVSEDGTRTPWSPERLGGGA